jgi:type IV secretory pathway VirB4 component
MPELSTQQFLEIEDIKEGVLILKNKSLRGIIMVSSLNFALKSEEEQNAIIFQFQNFLNSLDFPIEILIQSRRLNITGYLEKLKDLEKKQENELLKHQTADYRKFIESLVAGGQIFVKNFLVIVPFYLMGVSTTKGKTPSLSEEQFQRSKSQLWQRMEFVIMGLRRCGLQCVPLGTTEIIELLWSFYHPKEAEVGYFPEIPPEIIK